MGLSQVRARWRQLDPVFIRGMQRSGTSVMAQALRQMGTRGFGEGHLWFELVKPLDDLRDEGHRPQLRVDPYTLGEGRVFDLEKYIALALDQFHRDHLPGRSKRWMDKSPGAEAVRVAPLLANLFPKSQFIFMYRNGITTVHSAVRRWCDHEFWSSETELFETMCRAWAETMSSWREVRGQLSGRYIEVAQEELASQPFEVASRLTDFVGVPHARSRVARLFRSRRVGTSFPERPAGDYDYQIAWGEEQRAYFAEVCEAEMETWGFQMDFDSPGPARRGSMSGGHAMPPENVPRGRPAPPRELEDEGLASRELASDERRGPVTRSVRWLRELRLSLVREDTDVGGRNQMP